ncbi:MAG TPA: competence protein CoiA family protein [Pedobacter sp.]|nr:competence protein CoiA family protein [Pedobacter sp.]
MRFAIIENSRVEARSGLKGTCPACNQLVIARCGKIRVHHWSHQREKMCDKWWENETEWHRSWKNNYPEDYQEISLLDQETGERHFADVKTEHRLVIEFQHSPIHYEERMSREKFYGNMVWVVDGSRLKNDYKRFAREASNFYGINKGLFKVNYPEDCFPNSWLESTVPIVFDFQQLGSIANVNDKGRYLYCLFPIRIGDSAIIAEIPYQAFIKSTLKGEWSLRMDSFMTKLLEIKKEYHERQASEEERRHRSNRSEFTNRYIYKRRRVK